MSSVKIATLSSTKNFPFNTSLEDFFDNYNVDEDVECYQLYYSAFKSGTNFNDLSRIKFKSKIVILNIIDAIKDENQNIANNELIKFCLRHPENNFILFSAQRGFINEMKIKNLYVDVIQPAKYTKRYKHCNKSITSNKWLLLNSLRRLHRIMTINYLLSKEYYKNGFITFNFNSYNLLSSDFTKVKSKISKQLKNDFLKGQERFKNNEFNLLKLPPNMYHTDIPVDNYNIKLLPIYERIGMEIVLGTSFFETDSILGEKEVQNIYAKNFPIYINACGAVKEFKKLFFDYDIDTFDDIIDHSYDEIQDPFKRMVTAIDKNEKLLNGSTNIRELWGDNRKRFEENCNKMDLALYDKTYQKNFNDKKIKKSLNYFNVSCEHKNL